MFKSNRLKTSAQKGVQASLLLATLLSGFNAQAVGLQEYLNQVQERSSGYKATVEQSEAGKLKAREADLIFTPQFFANARVGFDGKESSSSSLTYDEMKMQNYSLGISQSFSFGLQTKLSYALDRVEFVNSNLPSTSPKTYWYATPVLEMSLPLWANGFGRSAEANYNITLNQNKAEEYGARAQQTATLIEAEAAYWRLSAAQEVVQVQTRALKNAQNILDYVSKKARMNLGEQADILQAQALVEATKYQLQLAESQEKAARRAFNTLIDQNVDAEISKLDALPFEKLSEIVVPTKRPGNRADYEAAVAQTETAKSAAQLVAERNKPSLNLYGSYSINGKDSELNEALKNVGETQRDTAFIGLQFSMPLNISASSDAKAGALKSQKAAELNLQNKQFTQEQDWQNLTQQLAEAKQSLKLVNSIVSAQKAKLENERSRLRQGRTTTYQVLLFETDFSQSEANRVQVAAQILGLQAQLNMYNSSTEEGGK